MNWQGRAVEHRPWVTSNATPGVNRHPGGNAGTDLNHSCNSRSSFCFLPSLIQSVTMAFHGQAL
jgi:hypothetical protein